MESINEKKKRLEKRRKILNSNSKKKRNVEEEIFPYIQPHSSSPKSSKRSATSHRKSESSAETIMRGIVDSRQRIPRVKTMLRNSERGALFAGKNCPKTGTLEKLLYGWLQIVLRVPLGANLSNERMSRLVAFFNFKVAEFPLRKLGWFLFHHPVSFGKGASRNHLHMIIPSYAIPHDDFYEFIDLNGRGKLGRKLARKFIKKRFKSWRFNAKFAMKIETFIRKCWEESLEELGIDLEKKKRYISTHHALDLTQKSTLDVIQEFYYMRDPNKITKEIYSIDYLGSRRIYDIEFQSGRKEYGISVKEFCKKYISPSQNRLNIPAQGLMDFRTAFYLRLKESKVFPKLDKTALLKVNEAFERIFAGEPIELGEVPKNIRKSLFNKARYEGGESWVNYLKMTPEERKKDDESFSLDNLKEYVELTPEQMAI